MRNAALLAGGWSKAELIHEHGRITRLEGINEADAPGVDARAVCAHAQAEEVLEARMVERTECLRVLDSNACEQRQVGSEDPGSRKDGNRVSQYGDHPRGRGKFQAHEQAGQQNEQSTGIAAVRTPAPNASGSTRPGFLRTPPSSA